MSYPDVVYVATNAKGVYKTADFTGAGGTMPTWTKISSIEGGGTLTTCDNFYMAQSGTQFVINDRVSSLASILYRRTNANWTNVLTAATVKATYGWADCIFAWVTGYGSTLYLLIDAANSGVFILTSTNDGLTWGSPALVLGWPYRVSQLIVDPDTGKGYVFANITGGGGGVYVAESDASFANWVTSPRIGIISSYKPAGYLLPTSRVFVVGFAAAGVTGMWRYTSNYPAPGSAALVGVSANALFNNDPEAGYPALEAGATADYNVPQTTYATPNRLISSSDDWATKTVPVSDVGQVINAVYLPDRASTDFILTRATAGSAGAPHLIYAASGAGVAATGRAGIDPANLATTVSIPYDAGGICAAGVATIVSVTGATITPDSGNTYGLCEDQTFTASYTPTGATTPITYVWSTDGLQSGQGTATAVYNWTETCDKTVTVTISNAGGSATATYTFSISFTLMQIATAIRDTIAGAMTASLLSRSYNYDELPEGVNDAPSLMVYWQSIVDDKYTDTDRTTLGGVRVKELVFHADYYQNPRNNMEENNDLLTQGASEIIDILEQEVTGCTAGGGHCPPFGLCGLKTFRWTGERVTFDYGGVLYYGARFIITVRVY